MTTVNKYAGKVNAPEFPPGLGLAQRGITAYFGGPARQADRPGLLDVLLN